MLRLICQSSLSCSLAFEFPNIFNGLIPNMSKIQHIMGHVYKMSRISYANVETVMLFRFRKNGEQGLEWKTDEQNRVHFWVDKNTLKLSWQLHKSANKLKTTELYNLNWLIIPCEIHINKVFFKNKRLLYNNEASIKVWVQIHCPLCSTTPTKMVLHTWVLATQLWSKCHLTTI